jgi:multidrug efflux pump subunit AcrA (membrane-fusion protein)
MLIKFGIPLLSLAGIALAVHTVRQGAVDPVAPPLLIEPARAPFESYIAAAGIIEASTENIAVASVVPGVVTAVHVQVGEVVQRGQPLFQLDERDLLAQLEVELASVSAAQAKLARWESLPRIEDVRTAEARAIAAVAALGEAQDQWKLVESVDDERAISREEINRRRSAVDVARARRDAAQALLDWHKTGAWKPDLDVARAELAQTQSRVKSVEMLRERLLVRAPIDGTVLQLNLRAGEYAPTGVLARPLLLLGDTRTLHVRADIDENDAWRFRSDARAVAFVRGNRELETALAPVRVEPYVVPKRSLTGESTERVDTRVLQVLYSFDPANLAAYVGQQVDVFIEAPSVVARGASR